MVNYTFPTSVMLWIRIYAEDPILLFVPEVFVSCICFGIERSSLPSSSPPTFHPSVTGVSASTSTAPTLTWTDSLSLTVTPGLMHLLQVASRYRWLPQSPTWPSSFFLPLVIFEFFMGGLHSRPHSLLKEDITLLFTRFICPNQHSGSVKFRRTPSSLVLFWAMLVWAPGALETWLWWLESSNALEAAPLRINALHLREEKGEEPWWLVWGWTAR